MASHQWVTPLAQERVAALDQDMEFPKPKEHVTRHIHTRTRTRTRTRTMLVQSTEKATGLIKAVM